MTPTPLTKHYRRLLKNAQAAERRASRAFDRLYWIGGPEAVQEAAERLDHAQQIIYDLRHAMRCMEA